MKATLSERLAAWLILPLLVFAIWLDNHPINIPDLTPHIDRIMDAIDPAH